MHVLKERILGVVWTWEKKDGAVRTIMIGSAVFMQVVAVLKDLWKSHAYYRNTRYIQVYIWKVHHNQANFNELYFTD